MNLAPFFAMAMADPGQSPADQPQSAQPAQTAPEAHPEPGQGSVVANTQQKKSGGCFKWIMGCGCLSIIVLIGVVLIGGGLVFWQAPKAVGADSWGETMEFFEGTQKLAENASSVGGGGGGADQPADLNEMARSSDPEERQEFNDAVGGFNKFFDSLDDTEISTGDVAQAKSEMSTWNDSRTAQDFNEIMEEIEELQNQGDSPIAGLRLLRSGVAMAFRANDLGLEYKEMLDAMSPAEREQFQQIMTLARLSQFSASNDHEPWSQEVADALVKDHDENREKYEQSRQLYRQAMEDPDFNPEDLTEEEQRLLTEAFGDQVLMITSAINKSSLQTWADLSDEERREFIETIDEPHNIVARMMAGTVHADEDEAGMFYIRMLGF